MSVLPDGYADLPPGKLANVVTYLDMTSPPPSAGSPPRPDLALVPFAGGAADYRRLFRRVGEDWLWFSRLALGDEALAAILRDPAVTCLVLEQNGAEIGLLELDFRPPNECELAFCGVVPEAIGTGAGRFLIAEAIRRAFAAPIRRLFVHTCTLDHPGAVAFYMRAGFRPYKRAIEIHDDPRLTGLLPRHAAPQVPPIP